MDPVGLAVLAAVVGVVGIGVVGVRRPSVEVVDVGRWVPVSDERIDIITTVRVTDVHPVLAAVSGRVQARYHIDLNGVRLATGEKDGIDIDSGTETVELRTTIHHENIPQLWATYIRTNESITVTTSGKLTLGPWGLLTVTLPTTEHEVLAGETPVIDALASAANGIADSYTINTGSIVSQFTGGLLDLSAASPRVGYEIEGGRASWQEVTPEQTTVLFEFVLRNSGDVPVPSVPEVLNVTLEMNDVPMFTPRQRGASLVDAAAEPPLAPGEQRRIEYPVTMDNEQVDAWFRSHVRNGERTDLTASVRLVFRPLTFDAAITLPPDRVPTVTCEIQTGILVDQDTNTTCDGPVGGSP